MRTQPKARAQGRGQVMAMHTRHGHLRGMADLKTLAGLGARQIAPHAAYMKITSLELEKLRLGRVRQNAERRIAEIDARYKDIEAEKAGLLSATGSTDAENRHALPPPHSGQGFNPRRMRGLSLRY